MTPERYHALNCDEEVLTREEIAEGWHFCPDWNFLLVGPNMEESKSCLCRANKPCESCEE